MNLEVSRDISNVLAPSPPEAENICKRNAEQTSPGRCKGFALYT